MIRPGEPWASPGHLEPGEECVESNAELHAWLARAPRLSDGSPPRVGVVGGDLARTVGVGEWSDRGRPYGEAGRAHPVDLGEALLDGRPVRFGCHLVAYGPRHWLGGRSFTVVCNSPWWGRWNVAPRAHPNDGLLDALDFTLRPREWRAVRDRLPAGAHLPHPRISVRRSAAHSFEWPEPRKVVADDVEVGRARRLMVRVEPDAWVLIA